MTYAAGAGLQEEVYALLDGDAALAALLGPRGGVYDGLPRARPDLYVALGPEDMGARGDSGGSVARHDMVLTVATRSRGFADAKRAAARVAELLDGAALTPAGGRLMAMRLRRARARVDEGEGVRRIDMWFRARIDEAEV
jgi:hypothetical protein